VGYFILSHPVDVRVVSINEKSAFQCGTMTGSEIGVVDVIAIYLI